MAAGGRLLGSIVQRRSAGHVEDRGDESQRRATMGDRGRDQQLPCEIAHEIWGERRLVGLVDRGLVDPGLDQAEDSFPTPKHAGSRNYF